MTDRQTGRPNALPAALAGGKNLKSIKQVTKIPKKMDRCDYATDKCQEVYIEENDDDDDDNK